MINKIKCPYCDITDNVRKHGFGRSGYQRYYCACCRKTFQSKYIYSGWDRSKI